MIKTKVENGKLYALVDVELLPIKGVILEELFGGKILYNKWMQIKNFKPVEDGLFIVCGTAYMYKNKKWHEE